MNCPLSLNRHFVTKIQLEAIRSEDPPEDTKVGAEVSLGQSATSKSDWTVQLKVDIKSNYVGQIEMFGHFTVDPDFPEEKTQEMVGVNGPSILYGAAREMVANITARGPHPMICLPSVSFHPSFIGEQAAALPSGKKPAKKKRRSRKSAAAPA